MLPDLAEHRVLIPESPDHVLNSLWQALYGSVTLGSSQPPFDSRWGLWLPQFSELSPQDGSTTAPRQVANDIR